MSPMFISKSGKVIISKPHIATFNDVHNASKTKVFIVLYHRKNRLGLNTGLNVRDIHLQSNVDYDYLRTRMSKWHEWGYLSRRPVDSGKGRAVYTYMIAKRGEHFIEDIVPGDILNQYIAEIKAFKSKQANLLMKNENLSGT